MRYYTAKNQESGWRRPEVPCSSCGTCQRRPVAARSTFMRSEEIDRERAMSGWNPYYGEEEETMPERMEPGMPDRMNQGMESGMPHRMNQEMEPGMPDRMRQGMAPGMQNRMTPGMGPEMAPGQPGQMNREMMPERMNSGIGPEMAPGQPEQMDRDMMPERMNPGIGPEMMPEQMMPHTTERTTEIMQPYFMQPDYAQVLEEQKMAERDLRMLQSMYPEAAKLLLPYIEEECDKMEYEGSTMYDEYPDPTTIQRLEQRIYEQTKDQLPEVMVQTDQPQEQEDILSMQYQGNRRRRGDRSWPNDLIRILLLQEMHHRRCRHRGCRRGRL